MVGDLVSANVGCLPRGRALAATFLKRRGTVHLSIDRPRLSCIEFVFASSFPFIICQYRNIDCGNCIFANSNFQFKASSRRIDEFSIMESSVCATGISCCFRLFESAGAIVESVSIAMTKTQQLILDGRCGLRRGAGGRGGDIDHGDASAGAARRPLPLRARAEEAAAFGSSKVREKASRRRPARRSSSSSASPGFEPDRKSTRLNSSH